MKAFVLRATRSVWLFALCAALYLGFAGPWLISAASTPAVLLGLGLFGLLAAWGRALLRHHLHHEE